MVTAKNPLDQRSYAKLVSRYARPSWKDARYGYCWLLRVAGQFCNCAFFHVPSWPAAFTDTVSQHPAQRPRVTRSIIGFLSLWIFRKPYGHHRTFRHEGSHIDTFDTALLLAAYDACGMARHLGIAHPTAFLVKDRAWTGSNTSVRIMAIPTIQPGNCNKPDRNCSLRRLVPAVHTSGRQAQ